MKHLAGHERHGLSTGGLCDIFAVVGAIILLLAAAAGMALWYVSCGAVVVGLALAYLRAHV